MDTSTEVPEPVRTFLLICMGVGFIISFAGTAALGCWIADRLANFAYLRGRHAYAFMCYMVAKRRGQLNVPTERQIEEAITNGLLSFTHEIDFDKVTLNRKARASSPALAQVVREIRHRILELQIKP